MRVQSSPGQYDVVLTSFYMDLGKRLNSRKMGDHGIRRLIIDESHLAAGTCATRKNMLSFDPRFVWMLTGTPISSSTSDQVSRFGMFVKLFRTYERVYFIRVN